MDEQQPDAYAQHIRDVMEMGLRRYGRRVSRTEVLTTATLVANGYEQCQEHGTSFRAWVREHMSVSMPTAYKLLRIGQNMSQVLAWITERDVANTAR